MEIFLDRPNIVFCSLIAVVIVLWLRWRLKLTSLFQELGIPGPEPSLLFGNIRELNRKGMIQCQEEWIKKYGKVFGYYHGMKPILVVADIDLLKKIFMKDFQKFSDRPEIVPLRKKSWLDAIIPASDVMDAMVVNLKGEKWKEIRSILSPTFSTAKLKMMFPTVTRHTDITLTLLEKKRLSGEVFDIYDMLQRLTLDVICEQAFALDMDVQRHPDDPFFKSAKILFEMKYSSKRLFFGMCFPELGVLAMAVSFLSLFFANRGSIPPLKILSLLDRVIKKRRSNWKNRVADLLQLMMDASAPVTTEPFQNNVSAREKLKTNLTDLEIKANSLVVFLAGYETTGTALAFAFHFLVTHPEMQEQLQREIDQVMAEEGELNYYSINKLQSVDRFVTETLRLHPPAFNLVKRVAVCDVKYDDVFIPRGMEIQAPIIHLHRNSEYWTNPHIFNPDRFLPENKSKDHAVYYMPFGVGPRNCLGIRLVHITTQLVLAKILSRYSFTSGDPQNNLRVNIKVNTMAPDKVLVKISERGTLSENT